MDDIVFHELLEGIKEVLGDLKTDQKEIKQDISLIKEDLKVHIYRTDLLEDKQKLEEEKNEEKFKDVAKESKSVWKHINYAKGAIGLLGLLLTIFTILSLFHKI